MIRKKWLSALLSLFFPRYCLVCNKALLEQEHYLCLECIFMLPRTQFYLQPENAMEQLFWGKIEIRKATSFFYYRKGSSFKHLLYHLKYNGGKQLGAYLGSIMGKEIMQKSNFFDSIDLLIPVPLHSKKHKLRGYNQSEWIAKGISKVTRLPVDTQSLLRAKHTETQTRKSVWDRQENIKNAFIAENQEKLRNKSVLLIDDVVTTGATLTACASALSTIPGIKFSFLTLAMVEY